jgi:hypothetical protein
MLTAGSVRTKERMWKLIGATLTLFTMVPAMAFAGSATNTFSLHVAGSSGSPGTAVGSSYRSEMAGGTVPRLSAEMIYTPDALGNVGPLSVKLGLGGLAERDTLRFQTNGGLTGYTMNTAATYAADVCWYVPILRERQGGKAGALALAGNSFIGRGLAPSGGVIKNDAPYLRGTDSGGAGAGSFLAVQQPTTYGGWAQVTYYLTDKVFLNGLMGFQKNGCSPILLNGGANSNATNYVENYIINVMYDMGPSMRLGLEYTRAKTQYRSFGLPFSTVPVQDKEGTQNSLRFGAYYFF